MLLLLMFGNNHRLSLFFIGICCCRWSHITIEKSLLYTEPAKCFMSTSFSLYALYWRVVYIRNIIQATHQKRNLDRYIRGWRRGFAAWGVVKCANLIFHFLGGNIFDGRSLLVGYTFPCQAYNRFADRRANLLTAAIIALYRFRAEEECQQLMPYSGPF